jgi:hypothetical protein
MKMHTKALAAGLAILIAGTAIGWGASLLSHPQTVTAQDPIALAQPQEKPAGDLTPQIQFRSAPRVTRTQRNDGRAASLLLPSGTPVAVALNTSLSSKTAQVGEAWSGTVTEPVYRNGREVVPAGSTVHGIVAVATPAERGNRATLQLAMRLIVVNGRSYAVRGSSEAVVAGSPRLRNVGAVAGGAAAGALIGKAIGHSTKSAVIGAVIGGGASTAVVAASKGYQATIAAGREMEFTTG